MQCGKREDLHHNKSDQEAGEDEEDARCVQMRHGRVEGANNGARDPGDNDVGDEDMPRLCHEVGMFQGVPGDVLLSIIFRL